MVMSKRSERRERRLAAGAESPSRNGSSRNGSTVDASSATELDLASIQPLLDALMERALITEAQIDEALTTGPGNESELSERLLSMGFIDERSLVQLRADLHGLAIADLRQGSPDPEALALIPDAMAREHFVIPVGVGELGISVAMANQPTPELLSLLDQTTHMTVIPMLAPLSEIRIAIDNNYRAIGELDHLVQAFEAVEGLGAGLWPMRAQRRLPRCSPTTLPSSKSSSGFSPRPCEIGRRTFILSRRRKACGFATALTARSRRS